MSSEHWEIYKKKGGAEPIPYPTVSLIEIRADEQHATQYQIVLNTMAYQKLGFPRWIEYLTDNNKIALQPVDKPTDYTYEVTNNANSGKMTATSVIKSLGIDPVCSRYRLQKDAEEGYWYFEVKENEE